MGSEATILKELIIFKGMLLKFLTHMLYILTLLNPLPKYPHWPKKKIFHVHVYLFCFVIHWD